MAPKLVILIRHGQSRAQLFTGRQRRATAVDKKLADQLRDPYLSDVGEEQAQALGTAWSARGLKAPDLIVTSPLSRALQTAQLVFSQLEGCAPSIVIHPDLREVPPGGPKAWGSPTQAECRGRSLEELRKDARLIQSDNKKSSSGVLCDVDWSLMPEDSERPWWSEVIESHDAVEERLCNFCDWLAERPEASAVVVCHFNIIQRLLRLKGCRVENCEPIKCEVDQREWKVLEGGPPAKAEAAEGLTTNAKSRGSDDGITGCTGSHGDDGVGVAVGVVNVGGGGNDSGTMQYATFA
eukprot:TRINITY_DN40583_c0_g1_i1.p1 TRINITY_DN40583_c0_g1~~TRINITY_DN40583_c0_g1_i1.p1  ORF type:complete len:295 (+),score=61.22 TRINITY_DN40583_c0_g1_i1:43-927(+)